jgi:putative transposase
MHRKRLPVSFLEAGSSFASAEGMPRRARAGTAGMSFHVINRGVRRARLFDHEGDYRAFVTVMQATLERVRIRLFAFCIMPNHFHLLCSPTHDGQLSEFMRLMTGTHSKRWHAARGTSGTGCVYQGRFKAFPVQTDRHFLTVGRYVERNALRARLVDRAEEWPWSSLSSHPGHGRPRLTCEWPVVPPGDWLNLVNGVETHIDAVRLAVKRSRPYGDDDWVNHTAANLQLQPTLNPIGRPTKP